jgi:hypothetical protein
MINQLVHLVRRRTPRNSIARRHVETTRRSDPMPRIRYY